VPFFVVADPEVARRVNGRLVERAIGAQVSADKTGKDLGLMFKGLAAAK
jgi:hypothetical protein